MKCIFFYFPFYMDVGGGEKGGVEKGNRAMHEAK